MARYTPLFYRGAPASIPQVVAHIQRTLTEEDPDYTPLRQRMPPASIPEIVAHIQDYLTANVFVTMEDLGEDIAAYIEAHPEIVGVYTVNGASGNVALDASDIPIETGEDPTVAGAISYLSSQLALLVADAVLSVNGVTPDDSHNVTLTGANIAQDANTTKKLSETFGPASASAAGSKGLVPAPQAGDENRVLSGSGAWVDQPTGAVQTVCNVGPNAQGNIPLMGSNIPLQSMSLQTVSQAIAAVDGKTGSAIPTSTTDNTPISTSLSNLNDQIGNLADLDTTDKTSIVAAINEAIVQSVPTTQLIPSYPEGVSGYDGGCYYSVFGNVVYLRISMAVTGSRTVGHQIAFTNGIPEKYKPVNTISVVITDGTANGTKNLVVGRNTISIYPAQSSGNEYWIGVVTYVI